MAWPGVVIVMVMAMVTVWLGVMQEISPNVARYSVI